MLRLPPLDALRFFEAAARHESFARAAEELCVTPSAVAQRIKTLEEHLGGFLFDRVKRRVRLNRQGKAYLTEVQEILSAIHDVTERQRSDSRPARLRIVSAEAVAERWLLPALVDFASVHRGTVFDLETRVDGSGDGRRDFDACVTCIDETATLGDGLCDELLFEESLTAVCSPALLDRLGTPSTSEDLRSWPLLSGPMWDANWAHWFAAQACRPPDMTLAWSFDCYGLIARAAVAGTGAAVGHPALIGRELRAGELVPVLENQNPVPVCYRLITTTRSRSKPEVQAFRAWLVGRDAVSQPASGLPGGGSPP